MAPTRPLAREQQLLLQQLMASHCWDNETAREVWKELQETGEGGSTQTLTVEEAFAEINSQLTKGFGLEIVTVALPDRDNPKNLGRFHAVVNLHADQVAKRNPSTASQSQSSITSFQRHNPHEMAMIRTVLQQLVNDTASRKDLINLRGTLEEPYQLSLAGAEHVVQQLVEEQWLRLVPTEGQRRESLQVQLELAPRTYLELSHTLVDMGMVQEDLPQFIFHRV